MAVKILAVDDSATMRKIMEMTFAGEDAEIVTIDSGEEALAKAKEVRPDVIFADASMKGMDGYAVAHAIKSDSSVADAAIILLASQHTPYDESKGKSSGVDDHVAKPFDSQAVIDKVASVLVKPRSTVKTAASAPPPPAAAQAPAAPKPQAPPLRSPKRTVAFGAAPPGPPAPKPRPALELSDEPVIAKPKPAPTPAKPTPAAVKPAPKPRPTATRAKPAAAATSAGSPLAQKLGDLGLNEEQVNGVLALSREVIEQVVWEVVPELAETLIKEEIQRLTS